MKKSQTHRKLATLELKSETLVLLGTEHLKEVAGGNTSTRRSQCPTLCF